MSLKEQTAILFFSRSAKLESKHKNWTGNAEKDYDLAQLLINSSASFLKKLNKPIYIFDEHRQQGNSFGEKLANAFEALYRKGYKSVVALGNDFFDWQSISWNEVFTKLQDNKSVIGPNLRGGAYLIGVHQAHFNKQSFEQLPWQSNKLYNELLGHFNKNNQPLVLDKKRDVNTRCDIVLFLRSQHLADGINSFSRLLNQLLHNFILKTRARVRHFISIAAVRFVGLRAPPIY